MQCPSCNVTLVIGERRGIEIDYCPQCRGVWLDRGELDKLIAVGAAVADDDSDHDRPRDGSPRRGVYEEQPPRHKDSREYKRRESFWSNLFDFD
ncbi:conserved hypothetical protein [Pirellula staleyi DSM 6068]|uniref:Transcription factor zinc-finger domain-containing protein n=1 Tax=Pirellula staleyi (strain ATCC 27377 / DSM 6068 / ICPB 4128) TaxID=530564 RepID=D2QW52_PIRSD|nr:zf-TFIIB domain-containing protein [Pirellula staleyi]ADB15927.1 conserved hypothetical protein [Pirellula staleyi DSM 6068]